MFPDNEPREVSLEAIKDPNFTSGLPIGEYLDRFRDGTPGLVKQKPSRAPAPADKNVWPVPAAPAALDGRHMNNMDNPGFPKSKSSLLDGMTSAERKQYPVTTGVFDYFRDALFAVAHVSYKGNEKHNPGEPLHWARGKSADEPDAIGRHLLERDEIDDLTEEVYAANLAWRALADLQKTLEKKYNILPPRGCK